MTTQPFYCWSGEPNIWEWLRPYEQYDVAKDLEEASQVLGYDVRALIDQDEEKLNQTRYTPAILTTSLCYLRLLADANRPDIAGLSLGELLCLGTSFMRLTKQRSSSR